MLTIEQIRAARALLDWSQSDLADQAGLSQTGIARIENGSNQPNSKTLKKIEAAFEDASIEFLGTTGVMKKTGEIKTYHGEEGFRFFLDDVYKTVVKYGTKEQPVEVFLSNVVHDNWVKWMGAEKWNAHAERMKEKKDVMDVRIIVEEGDWHFPAQAYSKYKWFPKKLFSDQSLYSYHNKLAFLNFSDDEVRIMIMHQPEFANGFRTLFKIAWESFAKTPAKI
ncbi:MAG: helix-turn-helix transcriptional regulator [Alphaproteobacteria bacterium]|nr:helix-turn-helix transcriptional regulator [Alphaproteobacteria bacterium]